MKIKVRCLICDMSLTFNENEVLHCACGNLWIVKDELGYCINCQKIVDTEYIIEEETTSIQK